VKDAINTSKDRLYELLPAVIRSRDFEQGEPLRALLQVLSEQVNVVEDNIRRSYENWFIETCEEWVVPYIGDLVGYEIVHEAGEPCALTTPQASLRNKFLIPRRDVTNTIRHRRRKGTLALLEELAVDVAGWSARAVEFYKLLSVTQNINAVHPERGRTVDIHQPERLSRLNGPFDELAHLADIRRISSQRRPGRYNVPNVGLFVCRLRPYSVTQTPAYCLERVGSHCYTFSILGNDAPIFTKPFAETDPYQIAEEINLPVPIRRRRLHDHFIDYYGELKSFQIWRSSVPRREDKSEILTPVAAADIIVADLSHWHYRPPRTA